MRIGYFLSCEEYAPEELVEQARLAEEAGFESLWISDHFHPWNDEQGQSPFVWSMIGAISQVCDLPVTTAVTCPTMRIHPAVIAQAAATSAVLLRRPVHARRRHRRGAQRARPRRPLAARRPAARDARGGREVIRALWTGDVVSHEGQHYTVDTARIYTLPEEPPQIFMSAFGPKALEVAGRIADGFITTQPDAEALQAVPRRPRGAARRPGRASRWPGLRPGTRPSAHAHRLWPNAGLPGELAPGAAVAPALRAGHRSWSPRR